ncbi:MAG TPA: alpha/beta fold hydrolase [Polyangiaceae bacterium]|nr:alpha/beta fold hydrolase [Polyangiaceae bacterium]
MKHVRLCAVGVALSLASACGDDSSSSTEQGPDAGTSQDAGTTSPNTNTVTNPTQPGTDTTTQSDATSEMDAGTAEPASDASPAETTEHDAATETASTPDELDGSTEPTSALSDAGPDAATPSGDKIAWAVTGATASGVPVESATLSVPVDYADPTGPQIELALARVKTTYTQARTGVVMFNPGGPGVGVVIDASDYADFLSLLFPTMDIVLVDNRGTGQSTTIQCIPLDQARELEGADAGAKPESDAAVDAGGKLRSALRSERDVIELVEQGCISTQGDLLQHMNSENVARDMDYVRDQLGEEVLNYWGVSYGTMQGALYAKMFPQSVRAFALDSPVLRTPNGPDQIAVIVAEAKEYETQLGRFFEWADSDSSSPLQGNAVGSAAEVFDNLTAQAQQGVTWQGKRVSPTIWVSVASDQLLLGDWPTFATAMANALQGDWSAAVEHSAGLGFSTEDQTQFNALIANVTLNLLENGCPANYGIDEALQDYEAISEAYPRLGPTYGVGVADCLGWDLDPAEPRIVASNLDAPPLLVMSAYHDPATPHADAIALVEQFANDSKLMSSESEGHGVATAGACQAQALADFVYTADTNAAPDECSPMQEAALSKLYALTEQRRRFVFPRMPLAKTQTQR